MLHAIWRQYAHGKLLTKHRVELILNIYHYTGPFEGEMMLIIIDAYSKWTEAEIVGGKTSHISIKRLKHICASQDLSDICSVR